MKIFTSGLILGKEQSNLEAICNGVKNFSTIISIITDEISYNLPYQNIMQQEIKKSKDHISIHLKIQLQRSLSIFMQKREELFNYFTKS